MPTDARSIKLFLSYARKDDEPFVEKLRDALAALGFVVWWDRRSMGARGGTFLDEIRNAISDCDRLVLVCGAHAVASEYVRVEWQYAQSICKVVNPILRLGTYDETHIPAAFPHDHIPDFRKDDDFTTKLNELVRLLQMPALPLGKLYGVPMLPMHYIVRQEPPDSVEKLIRADSIAPVVVTAKKQVTAVHGLGGIGKSTLTAALAQDCDIRRRFPDGIVWIEIGKTPDIATRLGDIGVTLGDERGEYPDVQRGKVRLGELLERKTALIILDDVWEHDHADAFRVPSSASRILMTTRKRLLATQLGAQEYNLETLTPEEGVRLFCERLNLDEAALTGEQRVVLTDLVEILGGHTQAVAIAAARLSEEGIGYAPELRQRITARRDGETPFKDLQLEADDRDFDLEASLSLSYDDLPSDDLRRRFRALGVFAVGGAFDEAAAAGVWEDADAEAAGDALRELDRRSLVLRAKDGRWTLHMLVHAYAGALARRAGEHEAAAARHFEHYRAQHGDYNANDDVNRHPQIALDFPQLQAALAWGFAARPPIAAALAIALDFYVSLREAYSTRRRLLEQAGQHGAAEDVASAARRLGDLDYMEDQYAAARANYALALTAFRAIPSRLGEANTLQALGDLDLREAQYAAARANYALALTAFRAIPDRLGEANTLKALGDLDSMEAQYAAARANYALALTAFRAIPSRLGEANTLKALGDLDSMEDQYAAARANYALALTAFRAIPDRLGEANTLKALGDLDRMEAQYAAARANYALALTAFRALPDRLGEANTLKALGDLDRMEAQYAAARQHYTDALALAEQIPDSVGQLNCLSGLARLEKAEGNLPAARDFMRRCLALADSIEAFRTHPVVEGWRQELASWG
jgi:tetratricopeptide (TPR) repeat protein